MVEKVTVPCPVCRAKLRMPLYVRAGKKPKCPMCGTIVRPEQVLTPQNLPTERMHDSRAEGWELAVNLPPPGEPATPPPLADPDPPVRPPAVQLDETFVPDADRPSPLPLGWKDDIRATELPKSELHRTNFDMPGPTDSTPVPPASGFDLDPPSAFDLDLPPSVLPPPPPDEPDPPSRLDSPSLDYELPASGFGPPPPLADADTPPPVVRRDPPQPAADQPPALPLWEDEGSVADGAFEEPEDAGLLSRPPMSGSASGRAYPGSAGGPSGLRLGMPSVPGFETIGILGQGGMGIVYRVRQVGLRREAALKMLIGSAYDDPTARARFLVEAEAVAQLRHPGVVQVYGYGEHDGLPFLCMEFVNGGNLAGRLERDGLMVGPAAAELLVQVCDAIAHAHGLRIVHRDLKPGNILMTADGQPKVADFGLARVADMGGDLTQTGILVGTPGYMAPEQAAGKKQVGPTADVYALGAILYEMLSGRTPLKGETVLETLRMAVMEEPQPLRQVAPGVPRALDTICMKCLSKEPKDRYPTAKELGDDLRRWLRGEPIHARPAAWWERAVLTVRRNKLVVGAAVGGAALAGLTVAAVLLLRG